jgi:hypothetical protein
VAQSSLITDPVLRGISFASALDWRCGLYCPGRHHHLVTAPAPSTTCSPERLKATSKLTVNLGFGMSAAGAH